jgi:hypothetical protein
LPAREIQAAPLAPNVASQVVPVIIGEAAGYQTYSENVGLSGTAASLLTKHGIKTSVYGNYLRNLAVTVVNPSTFESISPANFMVRKVSSGTADGDESYSIERTPVPSAPTLSAAGTVSVVPAGSYRYAVSYLVDIDTGSGTTIYEAGIGPYGTVTAGPLVGSVTLTGMPTTTPANIASWGGTVVGKNIYRSVNLAANDQTPNWSSWYKVSAGTAATITASNSTYADTASIVSSNPVAVTGIADGDTVTVQYDYSDANYLTPTIFSDFNDIVEKYGDAFTDTGAINSPVSFAAKLAILNGASNVVISPIPSGGSSNQSYWSDALLRLEDDKDGNIIVPLSGETAIHALTSAHITKMKQRNVWKSAILGMDGSSTIVTADTLRATASSYNSQDLCLVSPSRFNYFNSYLNKEVAIGGQYAAACLAGMHASRTLAVSLTRKQLAGISSVGDSRSAVGMNQDAQSGLLVVEQIPSTGSIRVRHDITTAPGDINTREYPVTLQRNNMINIIAEEIDRSIIGQIFADAAAPGIVATRVTQMLDNLVISGNLGGYSGVVANISNSDPTVVNVRWQYKPIYTVQYVQISFGINLTSGAITTGGINLVL